MKLSKNSDFLTFVAENEEENIFLKDADKYLFHLNEFVLEVYKDTRLLCTCDIMDNSIFFAENSVDALEAANLLGGRCFVVDEISSEIGEHNSLDRDFPLFQKTWIVTSNHNAKIIQGLEKLKKIFPEEQIYKDLFHNLHPNIMSSTEKKDENHKDELCEIYCRFNERNMLPLFLLLENKIVGYLRIFPFNARGRAYAYISDAVIVHDNINTKDLMLELFRGARAAIREIADLHFAFIRVSPENARLFEELGCGSKNPGVCAIEGSPSLLLKCIQTHIIQVAYEHLCQINSKNCTFFAPNAAMEHKNTIPEQVVAPRSPF